MFGGATLPACLFAPPRRHFFEYQRILLTASRLRSCFGRKDRKWKSESNFYSASGYASDPNRPVTRANVMAATKACKHQGQMRSEPNFKKRNPASSTWPVDMETLFHIQISMEINGY